MIPFKGRVVFRQYIPRKPHTTGVKYWAMVDSFGYLYSFEIYIGAKKFKQIRQGAQLASEVIKTLVSQVSIFLKKIKYLLLFQLPSGPYLLFADNFFGGNYDLMKWMDENNRKFVFLARKDRPKGLFLKLLNKIFRFMGFHSC